MKKKDVPQDNEGIHEGKFRDLCYAIDEEGKYTTVHSTGWSPKNTALLQAWELVDEKLMETKEKVLKGELSPLAYFMEKNIMTPKLLSQYTNFSKWKVKRHLKPKHFNKLDDFVLQKYADNLNVDIEELKQFGHKEHQNGESE